MRKRTKVLQIPRKVKAAVAARDSFGDNPFEVSPCCVLCGTTDALPEAHYIARSSGGLGVEENIVTLCRDCHRRMDQTWERETLRCQVREYLQSKYPNWNESDLIYRRD